MSAEVVYVNDVVTIEIVIIDRVTKLPVPLPNAPISVTVKKPSGDHVTWSFAPVTDGSDSRFAYTTARTPAPDLDIDGTWTFQPTPQDGVGPFAADPDTLEAKPLL